MADTTRATALQLSATELKSLTKWPDAVIYEFLSLQAGVKNITENINIAINNTAIALTLESQSTARITELSRAVVQLEEQVHAFDALRSMNANLKLDLLVTINNNRELLAALTSLIAKVASNKRDQQRIINNLTEELASAQARNGRQAAKITALSDQIVSLSEQMAIPDTTLLSRVTRNADAILNLQQEMAGS
jgi:hypothetical protein